MYKLATPKYVHSIAYSAAVGRAQISVAERLRRFKLTILTCVETTTKTTCPRTELLAYKIEARGSDEVHETSSLATSVEPGESLRPRNVSIHVRLRGVHSSNDLKHKTDTYAPYI